MWMVWYEEWPAPLNLGVRVCIQRLYLESGEGFLRFLSGVIAT
jgi:hypothetical protein